ncbi:MAG: 50S ribosomal protein L9 [Verrucomicrobia bacterium]|nr:MAG: 50S ribosomal protein L9 [Verrucomicrobiota bacterium]
MATSQVILTEAISTLGAEADIVKVRSGYARNFLVPHGKALEVTPATLRKINHLKAKRAEREARELVEAEALASKINKLRLSLTLETGFAGKAFGSITAHDLIELIKKELGELSEKQLSRHSISLERPIKETGEKTIPVRLHPEVTATLHITIRASSEAELKEAHESEGLKKPRTRKESAAE